MSNNYTSVADDQKRVDTFRINTAGRNSGQN